MLIWLVIHLYNFRLIIRLFKQIAIQTSETFLQINIDEFHALIINDITGAISITASGCEYMKF